jgi:hypothetical protein
MRLVYSEPLKHGEIVEVQVGDNVSVGSEDEPAEIWYFRPPHKPASSGKVTVKYPSGGAAEYYVGVIGAEWIEREDRPEAWGSLETQYFQESNV